MDQCPWASGHKNKKRRLETYGFPVQRPDEGVPISIFGGGDRGFGLDNRVDTADCRGKTWDQQMCETVAQEGCAVRLGG